MQMAMMYRIPGILSTCASSILDPSNMVVSVDFFNKARVFYQLIDYIKGSFSI